MKVYDYKRIVNDGILVLRYQLDQIRIVLIVSLLYDPEARTPDQVNEDRLQLISGPYETRNFLWWEEAWSTTDLAICGSPYIANQEVAKDLFGSIPNAITVLR